MEKCYKCKKENAQYLVRSNKVCRNCFVYNTEHLFRSSLKNQLFPKKGEKVLACVSGGANSMVMLELVDTCRNSQKTKKLMQFVPDILYIDDSVVYNTPSQQTQDWLNKVREKYQVECHLVKLEEEVPDILETLPSDPQAKSDLLYIKLHNIIEKFAFEHNYLKVITGESASRISVLTMTQICKGRGIAANKHSASPYSTDKVIIAKPLKEFLDKEIRLYQHVTQPDLLTKLPLAHSSSKFMSGSIDMLIENFLHCLQDKFPSTTHTLLRTSGKLRPLEIQDRCELCQESLDRPTNVLEEFKVMNHRLCYACHHLTN